MPYSRSYTCAKGTTTPALYRNLEDFERCVKDKLLVCPCCGSDKVDIEIASPQINAGLSRQNPEHPKSKEPTYEGFTGSFDIETYAEAKDVGPELDKLARAMTNGDIPYQSIKGTVTAQEIEESIKEGYARSRPSGPLKHRKPFSKIRKKDLN